MKRDVLEEVEQLLRVYCHHPRCQRVRQCPLCHPRCAKRLGYNTAIAWRCAEKIKMVLELPLMKEDVRSFLWSVYDVVRLEKDVELAVLISRAIDALKK